jgi:hypothetical protein
MRAWPLCPAAFAQRMNAPLYDTVMASPWRI